MKEKRKTSISKNNVLLEKADELTHLIYKISKSFPKSEMYGITSQIRRSSLSVPLNIIEGYARFKVGSHIQFLEISYGSLKETRYLIEFSYNEGYMDKDGCVELLDLSTEIEKMLYAKMNTLRKKSK